MKKDHSDAELTKENAPILFDLRRRNPTPAGWYTDAGIKDRGTGLVNISDGFSDDVTVIDGPPPSERNR